MRLLKIRKAHTFLVGIMMMAILFCCTSQVQAAQSGDYEYTVTDGKATITKYTGTGGIVAIPGTLGGFPVTSIGDTAFFYCTGLSSISIPQGVTSIGDSAFYECTGLTSISIPQGVTSIGRSPFSWCTRLTSIIVARENSNYTSIDGVLFNKAGTILIECPGGLTTISIPESVITIGDHAFSGCTGITSISIPQGVTSIERSAFYGCIGLRTINIPASVTRIGYQALSDYTYLNNIIVARENLNYTSIEGVLYNKAGTTLITCPTGLTTINIPQSVTCIGEEAFVNCDNLTTINIPQGITSIGDSAFSLCNSLKTISIPEGVTSIGSGVFNQCTGLTSIAIPESVTSIGSSAFNLCESLTAISIPQGVTSIGNYAFNDCTRLTTIRFNSATTIIYDDANIIPAITKIMGYSPSTAKDYATKYNRTFEAISASVDKSSLTTAITNATTLLTSKTVGTAVGNVSQAGCDAYNLAIIRSTDVKNNASATQAQVDAAEASLASATTAFNDAIVSSETWTDWPTTKQKESNETLIITFSQNVDPTSVNSSNLFVTTDELGTNKLENISVTLVTGNTKQVEVSPPTEGWEEGSTYYLFISNKVRSMAVNGELRSGSRMKFTIKTNVEEVISVDQVDENNMYKTNSNLVGLTGKVLGITEISSIKCTYQSVLSEQATEISVSGTSNWTISGLPLEIGTNKVTISVSTKSGKEFNKIVSVNRVNEFVELSENVVPFVPDNEEDSNIINGIAQSIVNFSSDDMGTPDDLTDDQTVLLVKEDCPLVVKLKQNAIDVGEIVSIPPCQQFLAGLTIKIIDFGEPDDFINYPPQDYEMLYLCTPGLADLFQGDISMDFSGYINNEDPIAFSMFPEGVQIYTVDESGRQTVLVEDELGLNNSTDSKHKSSAQTNSPGMQWGELKKLIVPSVSVKSGNSCDILVKFGADEGVVVYDKDGDLETKGDQVKVKGENGIKNLKTTAGVEWHPNFNPLDLDLLPQQVICKTTYDKTLSLMAEFSKGLTLTDVTENANKKLNAGFENKYQFLGMDVAGIDFKDCVVLGAFGIRLDMPPTYANLGLHQTTSKLVKLSPILLVMPVIDLSGKLEAKLAVTLSYNSYVESGSNIQKLGYTGSYGPLEGNRGQTSVSLPYDRQLEIYDLEAKSSTERNERPEPSLEIEGSGTAEASFGAGIMTGLMVNGIVPAAIKGVTYCRAKASLNGSAKWEDGLAPTFTGNGQVGVDAGVRMNIFAKLALKTGEDGPGFDYTHDWEYHFLDYSLSSISLKGKVSVADGDFDGTNNPVLTEVTVTAKKKYVANPTVFTATTDDQGNYIINGLSNGTYEVEFSKEGFIPYTDRTVVVSTADQTLDVILDKNVKSSLNGIILIGDNDTDMSNNTPLKDVKITAKKLAISGNYVYHATSDAMGKYNITDLYPGIYEVKAAKSAFTTITQIIIIMDHVTTTQNIAMELSTVNLDSYTGIATGKIINVLTGNGIGGITLNARAGLNQQDGSIIRSIVTDPSGQYSITLPTGNYTIEAIDNTGNNSYQSSLFNIKIVGGQTVSSQNGIMTPNIPDGQVRIILRWGSTPSDLDSHLVGPQADGSSDRFHIYYIEKKYAENGIRYADLDLDDMSSWGPETVTIYTQTPGKYRYFIHNYSNKYSSESMALANSGAYIEVYTSNSAQPLASYYVPYQEGTLWEVFEYDSETRQISPINTVTYENSSSSVGSHSSLRATDYAAESDLDIVRKSLSQEK